MSIRTPTRFWATRAFAVVVIAALASSPSLASTKTSIYIQNSTGGLGGVVRDSDTTGLADGPSSSSGIVENEARQAPGYVEALVNASEGKLGITIATHASTTNRSTYNSFGGTAEATWSDYVTFTAPAGTSNLLVIRGSLVLEGGVYGEAEASLKPTSSTSSFGSISLEGVGIADYAGSRRVDARGVVVDSLPKLEVIPFEITARSGVAQYLRFTLEAAASSTADATNLSGQSAWATGLLDYGHTLRWNGISSITDYQTGLAVEGVTVTSRSGFDYLNATPVPEAQTLTYALAGLGVLVAARKRISRRRLRQLGYVRWQR